jgi:two-component system response regulator FixJ
VKKLAESEARLHDINIQLLPCHQQKNVLVDRINEALKIDEKIINEHNSKSKVDSLSARKHEVFERVADGSMNKVIAADLGISERTVEVHRSHVMDKLEVRTLAELVRIKVIYEQLN